MNFYVISLGCPKNLSDTEDFCAQLIAKGSAMVSQISEADTVIINTCGFLQSAIKEAKTQIKQALKLKKQNKVKSVIVTGCLAERFGKELAQEFKDLNAVISIGAQKNMALNIKKGGLIMQALPKKLEPAPYKMILTAPHFAYLKVADGCDNRCAYCAIPFIRGGYRSKTIENVAEEANILVNAGVSEIALIAQDTTSYGVDLYGKPQIVKLLKELIKIKNLKRLRIMYAYPHRVTKELAQLMAKSPKIFKYLDIPLQHIAGPVLKNMNRHCGQKEIKETLAMLRSTVPQIAIRTNFIVGFPGETERDFKELLSFVKEFGFNNMGVFEYSKEPGTAAYLMKNQVPQKIKRERTQQLINAQSRVIDKINKSLINTQIEVIADTPSIGRAYMDGPDMDGSVVFEQPVQPGHIYLAKVTKAQGYTRTVKPLKDLFKNY